MPLFGLLPNKQEIFANLAKLAEGQLADLWTNVPIARAPQRRAGAVVFTSTDRGAGATMVAAACAIGLARDAGVSTLLVETFAGATSHAELFGLAETPASAPPGKPPRDWRKAIQQAPLPKLKLLPASVLDAVDAGGRVPHLREILRQAFAEFEVVLVEIPPLHAYVPIRPILSEAAEAVVVVKHGGSRKEDLRKTVEIFDSAKVKVLGVVMNQYRRAAHRS